MGMFHGTLVRFLGIVRLVACHFISLVPLALELQSAESLSSRKTVAQPAAWTLLFIAEKNESAMVK